LYYYVIRLMKKTKLKNGIGDYIGIDSFPWRSLIDVIIWKLEKRETEKSSIVYSINYSLIVDLTSAIEGFLNETFDNILGQRMSLSQKELESDSTKLDSFDDFKYRLIDFVQDKLENSTWSSYNEIFKVLVGKNLKGNIENELWKGISSLFTFRNMIVHGKILSIEYTQIRDSNDFEIKLKNKYKSVYSYLSEKNLIKADKYGFVAMVGNDISDHYVGLTKDFMKEVLEQIPNEGERNYVTLVMDDLGW